MMLIDERTISQAEHTGLFFESANGTTFVGTPTAGANGDVTNFFVPGGISIAFTGHNVRHADGRQLQRVGLQPQVYVAPTIKGLRAGKDEVLQKAIDVIKRKLKN
jgi:C-terminal processing protease CtpA/Prc